MTPMTQPMQRVQPWRPHYWPFHVSPIAGTWLRWTARIWLIVATTIFVLMATRDGIPRGLENETWEVSVQLMIFSAIVLGEIIAWRWQALGASIIVFGAVALGTLAAIEHSPNDAILIGQIFFMPGFLYWLDWQRTKSLRVVVTLAVALALVLGGGLFMTYRVYSEYMGPSHPVSATTLPKPTLVEWIWSGALTEDSITVKARLIRNSDDVHLLVSTSNAMRDAIRIGPAVADLVANDGVVTFQASRLIPGTDYYYAIEADGELDLSRQGHFETPESGVYSFTFAAASCALSGSNGCVFDAIRENEPLFFMATGDMFYNNISKNEPELYLDAYTAALTMPAQATLRLSTPTVYMWDDHDYGPNNSDRESPSREAAQLSYRDLTPSYPLVVEGETGPIYHAFTIGRVRFIMTDLRSERSPATDPDNADKTMLGEEQKAWFKQELLAANGVYPLIVWVQAVPWIAERSTGADHWGMYTTEREEIANFIADNDIEGILMISGDAHMLAIDDGTHSDYSTDGGGGFIVFHAAPLDRPANAKGGPYTLGPITGGGQFGLITVEDTGTAINVTLSGRDYTNEEKLHYEFTVPAALE